MTRKAWVINNGKLPEKGIKYLFFDNTTGTFAWTADIAKALQFSRKYDAETVAQENEDAWGIKEHEFACE